MPRVGRLGMELVPSVLLPQPSAPRGASRDRAAEEGATAGSCGKGSRGRHKLPSYPRGGTQRGWVSCGSAAPRMLGGSCLCPGSVLVSLGSAWSRRGAQQQRTWAGEGGAGAKGGAEAAMCRVRVSAGRGGDLPPGRTRSPCLVLAEELGRAARLLFPRGVGGWSRIGAAEPASPAPSLDTRS